MNVKLVTTTVIRKYDVEGAPLVQLRYRQSQIIPDTVEVRFQDGELSRVAVSGHRAKKDGSPGIESSEESWSGRYDLPKIPDWLTPFLDFNNDPTA